MASVVPLVSERSFSFEGEGAGAAAAYERWREEGAPLTPLLYDVRRDTPVFRANTVRLELPGAALVQFDYTGLAFERDPARVRADGTEGVVVQLTHAGGLDGTFGGREVEAREGSAVLADLSQPSLHVTSDSRGRAFYLPAEAFGPDGARRLHGRVATGAAFRRLDAYFTWLTHALRAAPASAAGRARETIATVVRATFDSQVEPELQASGALDGVLAGRLRELVAARAGDPELTVDRVARTLGVSRAALYRVAAPCGGVMEMVWRARLDAAHASLVDPGRSGGVGTIAAEHGFSTAQHFSRRFRARFGFNPSDLRPHIADTQDRATRP